MKKLRLSYYLIRFLLLFVALFFGGYSVTTFLEVL